MSQELLKAVVPTGSNWKAQSAGSAATTTGALALAAASCGLAAQVMAWNTGT